jgi:putative FmdB family regulatory protein
MPTYQYKCSECGREFEQVMPIREHEQKNLKVKCPKCQSSHVEQEPAQFQAVTSSKT